MANRSSFFRNQYQQIKQLLQDNAIYNELFWIILRWIILFIGLILIAALGGVLFETIDTNNVAENLRATVPLFSVFPMFILRPLVFVFDSSVFRYMIPAITALVGVLIAGAAFVKDVYELDSLRLGLHYVTASLFGMDYPRLVIDGGQKVIAEGETNLLDAIGGPGFALIQPGNAVFFRHLRQPTRASVTRTYFMRPFEHIGQIASLDDQHGYMDRMVTMTKDGIKVALCDVHFRFRILPEESNGELVNRSLQNPYPYSEDAMMSMAYNLSVEDKGLETWHGAVKRVIVGGIGEYINSHNVDHLTAPRQDDQDPRGAIRSLLFSPEIGNRLGGLGAELLWVDLGHIEILEEDVDKQRLDLWAAELIGDANAARAFGEAKRLAYQELGRAEAQAEMIISITQALENIDLGDDPAKTVREIILLRTVQLLDAIGENTPPKSGKS